MEIYAVNIKNFPQATLGGSGIAESAGVYMHDLSVQGVEHAGSST